ncbi:hypothetical protein VV02_08035 [Luteipulveratus mongoliensis]|uniref:Mycothiol-dependent maleylpyruvate isomerase metal-binding domain-containing protein n=1 Tax=Luteipulveratus mongoliensis TaxID=571913 RepID=A0A0K1JPV1_9MICO|nr:hypothetical protein VV02_08035 [Luteipulveratus mongoliensis]
MHREALAAATTHVVRLTDADLTNASACAGWDLATLLAHMVGQHRGFATLLSQGAAPESAYSPERFTQTAWQGSVADLISAFAGVDLDRTLVEIELHPTQPLPVHVLLGAQLLDTVVHTWDLAWGLGERFEPSPALADAVLAIAEQIPDDDGRERPGAAFAHAVPSASSGWHRALALLGRDPATVGAGG